MNYTFKLSRRIARFRRLVLVLPACLALACNAGDETVGPSSAAPEGAASLELTPGSTTLEARKSVQFYALTDSVQAARRAGRGDGGWRRKDKSPVGSISLIPATATVEAMRSVSFGTSATLADGSTVPSVVRWKATGGTIDSSGMYTAGSTPGAYAVVATASNGASDTAAVRITAVAPAVARVVIAPGQVTVATGVSTSFVAEAQAADGSVIPLGIRYAATGGSISPTGVFTAGQVAGSYRVIATDTSSGLADTAVVTIPPAALTAVNLVLTPASASLRTAETLQFSAVGQKSDDPRHPSE